MKQARKHADEPLTPADWESYGTYAAQPSTRAFKRVLRALPTTPRCGYCGAPFTGAGGRLVRPFDFRLPEQLVLKGKQEPFDIRRVRWFTGPT